VANNFILGDRSNTAVTFRSIDTGTGQLTVHAVTDLAGTPYTNAYALPTRDASMLSLGYYQNTAVTNSAAANLMVLAGLGSLPATARFAWIQPEGDVRLRDDGTSPTSNVGMRIYAGTLLPYFGPMGNCKLIAVGPTTNVNITFYV